MRKNLIWFIVFAVLPIIYWVLYGRHGFSDTDQGYIQSLSWRILNGETPYVDFIYVRPPLTPYLHAWELKLFPKNEAILFSHLVMYLFLWANVLFTTSAIARVFKFENAGISKWLFASLAFIFTAHNYPAMPWHTIDGLLFASMGLYLLTWKNPFLIFLGMLSMTLSALCKQPFYVAPFAGILLVILMHERKHILVSIISFVLTIGATILLMHNTGMLGHFLEQSSGASSLNDLVQTGIYEYAKAAMIALPIAVVILLVLKKFGSGKGAIAAIALFSAFILSVFIVQFVYSLSNESSTEPRLKITQVFFLIAFVTIAVQWKSKPDWMKVLIPALIICWATGISWGYANSMLYFTPLLFAMLLMPAHHCNPPVLRYWFYFLIILSSFHYYFLHQYPYRDAPRKDNYIACENDFLTLKGIYAGETNLGKLKALKLLVNKYGNKFSVFPSMPLAHYLLEAKPVLSYDWAHNAEILFDKNKQTLITELNHKKPVVFLEKDKWNEFSSTEKYGCSIGNYVISEWTLTEENDFFKVYQNPIDEVLH